MFIYIFLLFFSDKPSLSDQINAYGNWKDVKSVEFIVNGHIYTKSQGYRYSENAPIKRELYYHYNVADSIMFHQSDTHFPGGYVFDFAFIVKDTSVVSYNISGSRTGEIYRKRGKPTYHSLLNDIPYFLPNMLLQTLKESDLQYTGNARFLHNTETDSTVYIHNNQGRLQHIHQISKKNGTKTKTEFREYKQIDKKWIPTKMLIYAGDQLTNIWAIESLKFNTILPETKLKQPEHYIKESDIKKPLTLTKLHPKTYMLSSINGNRNSLIYFSGNRVVLGGAPLNNVTSKKTIQFIKKELDVAVTDVFISHHHSDHIGGIAEFYKQRATLIFHAHLYHAIADILKLNGLAIRPNQLRIFSSPLTFLDIQFHPVKNSHAEGLSFMYLPKQKLIYQGDFFALPEDGFMTPPIKVMKEFNAYITSEKINFNSIITHHATPLITKDTYLKMITYK